MKHEPGSTSTWQRSGNVGLRWLLPATMMMGALIWLCLHWAADGEDELPPREAAVATASEPKQEPNPEPKPEPEARAESEQTSAADASSEVVPADAAPAGLDAPEGFEVTLFAGDDLAHNIYSMTIDSLGRVVVAGPNYVKILIDENGDGRADRAATFSSLPSSGAHGLHFLGRDLVFTGDNMLGVLRDADGDDVADGPPEPWARLRHPEHGANGIVQGPDGWLYVVCGNDAGVGREHAAAATSPVKDPRCGAILRLAPDGQAMEVVAHGFRNPYDLDFGELGQLFTVDSDGERDHHLPWYAPTRLFDVAPGQEHGWLLAGWQRSWNRPEYFFDNVSRAAEFGRGSPTGLVVYRHRRFPERYRGAVYSACWSLGRVYVCPLTAHQGAWQAQPEVFLQTTGDVGFAPVALAVDPQGDMYVAIGGRGTRGSVFRVRYVGDGATAIDSAAAPADSNFEDADVAELLPQVLTAPQPLSAWSRARWVPLARRCGAEAFELAALDGDRTSAQRVRAIEVLVELFDGLRPELRRRLLSERPEGQPTEVTARALWAVGSAPQPGDLRWIEPYLQPTGDPLLARAAWEAAARIAGAGHDRLTLDHAAGLADAPRRVRSAAMAAFAAGQASDERADGLRPSNLSWDTIWLVPTSERRRAEFLNFLVDELRENAAPVRRLEALRLLQLALGDVRLQPEQSEVFSGYAALELETIDEPLRRRLAGELAALFPTEHADVDRELGRLLAMLECDSPGLLDRVATRWTSQSDPREDIHYLIVAARLGGDRSPEFTRSCATMLLRLQPEMARQRFYPSRNWPLRVGEAFVELCRRDPALPGAIAKHPQFGEPAHSLFASHLAPEEQPAAARRLLQRALTADEEEEGFSPELLHVLAVLPVEETLPHVRELWSNYGLRDAIVPLLAREPSPVDRSRLVESLSSAQFETARLAAEALQQLGPPADAAAAEELGAVLSALRQTARIKTAAALSESLLALLQGWAPDETPTAAPDADLPSLDAATLAWSQWYAATFPRQRLGDGEGSLASYLTRLPDVLALAGDRERGRRAYEKRSCQRCHDGAGRLGPDLAGVGGRFSPADLLTAIVDPSREISPAYRTTLIGTHSGKLYNGLLIYDSPDATLIQISPDVTVRVPGEDLAVRMPGVQSLMPASLLREADDQEIADLLAYLQSLRAGGR